jgi:hypothetical protein
MKGATIKENLVDSQEFFWETNDPGLVNGLIDGCFRDFSNIKVMQQIMKARIN